VKDYIGIRTVCPDLEYVVCKYIPRSGVQFGGLLQSCNFSLISNLYLNRSKSNLFEDFCHGKSREFAYITPTFKNSISFILKE